MPVIGIVLFSWRIEVAHEAVAARNLQSDVGVIGVTHHNVRYHPLVCAPSALSEQL